MKKNNFDEQTLFLQLFAEETEENQAEETTEQTEQQTDPKNEKKYSDEDLDKIIGAKFARWKEEQDKKIKNAEEEAAKLAKMNAEQKQQYEMEKLRKENEDLKKANLHSELSRSASGLLKERNIDATQDILDFVVGDDAEATSKNIDKFVKIVEEQVKRAEIARATGTTPRNITNNGNTMSEIDKRIAKYS
jgi:hypothetical protein